MLVIGQQACAAFGYLEELSPSFCRQMLVIGQQACAAFGYEAEEVIVNNASFVWVSGYFGDYLVAGLTRLACYDRTGR